MASEATPKEVKRVLEGCINFLSIEVMAVDIPSSVLMSLDDHVRKMRDMVEKLGKMETFSKETKSPSTVTRARATSQKMNMELKAASQKVSDFLKNSSGDLKAMSSKVSTKIQNTPEGIKVEDGARDADSIQPPTLPQSSAEEETQDTQDDIYDECNPITYQRELKVQPDGAGDEASISSNETTTKKDEEDKMKTLMSCSAEKVKTKALFYGTVRKHKQSIMAFKWSKRFCAIYENSLLYYKSETDQTPLGVLHLPTYKLFIPPNDKGFLFHLDGKEKGQPTYMFQADKLEEAEEWKKHLSIIVNKSAVSGIDNVSCNTEDSSSGSEISGQAPDNLTYDDVDHAQLLVAQQKQQQQQQQQQQDLTYDDVDHAQLLDAQQKQQQQQQQQVIVDDAQVEDKQLIYDDVDTGKLQEVDQASTPTKDEQPTSPLALHNRPPMPLPAETTPIITPRPTSQNITTPPPIPTDSSEFSIDNIYMGLHDCEAEDERDLAFKRGQILYILEKIDMNWWVAFLQGRVGLVPSNHLTTAFVE